MMFSLLGTLHQTHIWSDTCSELSTSVLLTSFDAVYSLIVFLKELYMKELLGMGIVKVLTVLLLLSILLIDPVL